MGERIGSVAGLWRYPVKSMQGERLDVAVAGERGLVGDRGWAVVDAETGMVASAKHPKLWLTLLGCAARYLSEPQVDGDAAPVHITLADGREVSSDDPDRDRILSEGIGRAVTLECFASEGASYEIATRDAGGLEAAEPEQITRSRVGLVSPPGTFFDSSTLHVLADSTLARFAEAHPQGRWDVRRFRPNVLVAVDEAPDDGFAERAWVGRALELGSAAQAVVLAQMPRCVMTTLPQRELPRDPLILRTVAERNRVEASDRGVRACAGVLSNVTAPGRLAPGDVVMLSA